MTSKRTRPSAPRASGGSVERAAPPDSPTRPAIGTLELAMLALVLLTGLALWLSFVARTHSRLEDALITFRYATNLAQGRGFVFNPGERVLGTTTPLLTLILALVGAVAGVGRISTAAATIGVLCGLGAAFFTHRALRAAGTSAAVALAATLILVTHPDVLWSTCVGMETPLVLMLMALSLHGLAAGRWTQAAVAGAVLPIARVDGGVWAVLVFGTVLVCERRKAIRPLAIALAIAGAWCLFAFLYFGSPIPHSVVAKRVIGPAEGGVAEYLPWFLGGLGVPLATNVIPAVVWWGCVLLGMLGIAADSRRHALAPLALFPLLFSTAMYVGRAPQQFPWYLVPLTWAGLLLGTLGMRELRLMLARHLAAYGRTPRLGDAIVALLVLPLVLPLPKQIEANFDWFHTAQRNEDGSRRVIGEWLEAHSAPDARVAMEAIGYQGFYSHRRVIDLAGLVSPEVVSIRRESRTNGEAFHTMLQRLRPEFLVLRSFEVDNNRHFHYGPLFDTPQEKADFEGWYVEAQRFEAPFPEQWGIYSKLTVYRRRDVPAV